MWPLAHPDSTGVPALDTAAVWAAALIAVLSVVGGAWRLMRRLRRIGHRVDQFIDDWQGVPGRPGVEPRPGVMERLAAIERTVGLVVHEVRSNGGGSMRDAIHRVDRRTASIVGDEEPPPPHEPEHE